MAGLDKGIAHTLAAFFSAAMMLDHLGHAGASKAVEQAIAAVLAGRQTQTAELGWIESYESGGRGGYLRTSLKGLTKPIDKASWAD